MMQLLLEAIRAGIFAVFLAYLWFLARKKGGHRDPGRRLIVAAFGFILFGLLLDITENFPELSRFVVLGPTRYEALLKNLAGFVVGFLLLTIGLSKLMAELALIRESREALAASYAELEQRMQERTAELVKANERLELAVEGGKLGVWDSNLATDDLFINPLWAEMLGYDHFEIEPHRDSWKRRIHPDDVQRVTKTLDDYYRGKTGSYEVEHRLQTKSGEWKWVHGIGKVVERDDDGKPLRAVGILQDITDRKRAEEALGEVVSLLASALESTADGILVVNREGRNILHNRRFQELWRISDRILDSKNDDEALAFVLDQLKDPEGFLIKVRELYSVPAAESFDVLEFKDGRVFERYSKPQLIDEEPAGRVWSFRDVTERIRMENHIKHELKISRALASLYVPLVSPLASIEWFADIVLDKAKSLTGSEHGYVAEIDPRSGDCVAHTLDQMLGTICRADAPGQFRFARGDDGCYAGLWGHALNTGEAFFTNSPHDHATSKGVSEGHIPIRRFLSVPVMLGDELVGQICLANPSEDYTEADLDAVQRVAAYYALAIRHKRDQTALREARDTLEHRVKERTADLVRANEALQESEERYRLLVDLLPVGVGIHSEGKFAFVNPAAVKTFGADKPEELIGRPVLDLMHPDSLDRIIERIQYMIGEWKPAPPTELKFLRLDGTAREAEVHAAPIVHEGKPSVLVAAIDISDRKQLEYKLKESEARFRELAELLPQFIYEVDEAGRMTFLNRVGLAGMGYTEEDLARGIDIIETVVPEDKERAGRHLRKMLTGAVSSGAEYTAKRKDGTTFPVLVYASRIEREGTPAGIRCVAFDITERKQAEEAIRAEREKFRVLTENAPFGLVMIGEGGDYQYLNPKFEEMFGYTLDEIPDGREWFNKAYPDPELRREVTETWIEDLKASPPGVPRSRVFTVTCKDGTEKVIHFAPVQLETGEHLVSFLDITDRVRAEEALRASEQRFKDLAELLPQMVYEVDTKGLITFGNRTAMEVTGYGQTDIDAGLNITTIFYPEDIDRAQENIARILRERVTGRNEYRIVRKDGTTFPVLATSAPIVQDGKVRGFRGVCVDITDLKQAEAELKSALEEKTVLLREVHHRVKNNLQVISSIVQLHASSTPDKGTKEVLSEVDGRVRAMAMVHEHLYRHREFANVRLRDYIRSVTGPLISYYAFKCPGVQYSADVEDVSVGIDTAVPLGLLLNELVTNCMKHAFPDGQGGEIRLSLRCTDTEQYELVVADNGAGIPHDVDLSAPKTLGLDLVVMLAKQLHAEVELNRLDGTVFKMIFKEIKKHKRLKG